MKRIQKLLVFMCALVATIAIAVPAYAAGNHTITIASETGGHVYQAYQVFSGVYNKDQSKGSTLSNIDWGSGIDESKKGSIVADLTKSTKLLSDGSTTLGNCFADDQSAADVAESLTANTFQTNANLDVFAEFISGYLSSSPTATSSDSGSAGNYTYSISKLDDGYYFITEDTIGNDDATDNAYTKFMLQVVGDVEIEAKDAVPTIQKQVQDVNDSTSVPATWGDSADYDAGDEVPFMITVTVAENIADFDTYKLIVHDDLAAGLSLESGFTAKDVSVVVNEEVVASGYEVSTTGLVDGCDLHITFNDVKALKDAYGDPIAVTKDTPIVIEYKAQLNNSDGVDYGNPGNDNVATLEYSSKPNDSFVTNKTTSDTVTVFTYQLIVNKVDDAEPGNKLPGAQFSLQKMDSNGNWGNEMPLTVDKSDASKFTIAGLDDGTYKLTETTTPAGYNTMEPIEFTIAANHEENSVEPKLTDLTGTATGVSLSFTPELDKGSLTTTVVNKRGATLPSTGGVGKTVLITAGAILVIGAGVGLVAKYRASRMK